MNRKVVHRFLLDNLSSVPHFCFDGWLGLWVTRLMSPAHLFSHILVFSPDPALSFLVHLGRQTFPRSPRAGSFLFKNFVLNMSLSSQILLWAAGRNQATPFTLCFEVSAAQYTSSSFTNCTFHWAVARNAAKFSATLQQGLTFLPHPFSVHHFLLRTRHKFLQR